MKKNMIFNLSNKLFIPISLIAWLIVTPVSIATNSPYIEPFQHSQIIAKTEIKVGNSFKQTHKPIRQPKKGSCSCPYDTDKAGRSCGRRSAYSRPNGDRPVCYQDD